MLRKAGPRMNDRSLPEMRGYLKRIGYEVNEGRKRRREKSMFDSCNDPI